jgi:hypothetical protein
MAARAWPRAHGRGAHGRGAHGRGANRRGANRRGANGRAQRSAIHAAHGHDGFTGVERATRPSSIAMRQHQNLKSYE